MKLRSKAFTLILVINLVLAIGLFLFIRTNFENSFTRYVSQRERDWAENLAQQLESHYRQHGNWLVFAESKRAWNNYLRKYHRQQWQKKLNTKDFPPPPPPADWEDGDSKEHPLPPRDSADDLKHQKPERQKHSVPPSKLFLLDANKQALAGNPWPEKQSFLLKLEVDGVKVGYLGIPIRREMLDYLDEEFAAAQGHYLLIITMAAATFALLISLPLSNLMVNRIQGLVTHVKQLSQGNFAASPARAGGDEIDILGRHLNDLGATLAAAKQQRDHWVADISHELRTPVAILRADLESIEDGVRPMDQGAVTRLQNSVRRLATLIEDLHQLSLADAGSLNYRKTTCDLSQILRESIEAMAEGCRQRGIVLASHIADGPIAVLADRERLGQLLLNLLQNSINYTDAPGQIKLSLDKHNNEALIRIEDSAPGVARELHSRLTERLFRVDASRARNSGGAGLGLSLCANIVAAHGGKIQFGDSSLGGLQVDVSIPLSRNAALSE